MPENMRTASAEHFDTLWSWNTLERRPLYCTLDFHRKVQVWGNHWASHCKFQPNKGVSLFQEGVSPSLLKKKEKKIIRREIYEKNIKKREKRRRKEWESHGSTHLSSTRTQIKRLLLFLSKPLLHHSDWSGLQEALFPHTRQEYQMPSLQQFQEIHPSCWQKVYLGKQR